MSQDERNGCESNTLIRSPRTQEQVALDAILGPGRQYLRCLEEHKKLSSESNKLKKKLGRSWKESLVAQEAHERAKASNREMAHWLRKTGRAIWQAVRPLPLIDHSFPEEREDEVA